MANFDSTLNADRIIKVCGMADAANIALVARLTPMLMGFIFYEPSPRNALALDPEAVRSLPDFIHPVGVFVDAPEDYIRETAERYGIRIVQLHGSESPGLCSALKSAGFTVLKAFGLDSTPDWEAIRPYEGVVDMFLFDTKCDSHGGSGCKFDWSALAGYPLSTPYLLSGGIGPDDSEVVVAAIRPKMAGVDINSRFEVSPGIKDLKKLTHFILSLRKHNEDI